MKLVTWSQGERAAKVAPTPAYTTNVLSSPTRTEVSDVNGWVATFTNGARTVALRGPSRTLIQVNNPFFDTFDRTRSQTGWGTASFGGNWIEVGGTNPGNYSVNGTEGTMTLDTAGSSRRAYLSSVVSNPDIKVRFKSDKTGQTDSIAGGLILGYTDIDNHYICRVRIRSNDISDTFSRTATSSWGDSDSGHSWTTSGGSASDYSVAGGVGVHSVGSVNSSRRTYSDMYSVDSDITVRVRSSVLATGASITTGPVARYADSNNYYYFRIRFSTTQTVLAAVQKIVAGTSTTLGTEVTVPGITHSANTFYRVRAQLSGSTLQMKVWADNDSEPAGWTVSLTDTTFTTGGSVGLRSILQTGNTNTLPVQFGFDDFTVTDGRGGTMALALQKQVGGTISTIGSEVTLPLNHTSGTYYWVRCQRVGGSTIQAKVWTDGSSEPGSWQSVQTDSTFTNGKVGVRAVAFTANTELPVVFSYDDFYCDATPVSPPTINSSTWVRLLPTNFTGTVDDAWLAAALQDTTPDALAIACQYLPNAPAVFSGGLQIAGDAGYGPLNPDGTRVEGSDFNDYLGISWQYGASTDAPEANQFKCLDCSGLIRMVYGYRLGMPMTSSTLDGVSIPRISHDMTDSGPGVMVMPNTPNQITDFSKLLPGDIVAFDADSGEAEANQIDHVGIYLGRDLSGFYRFISSRKTLNGPQLDDVAGSSRLDGSGLYATRFRAVRRF